MTALVVTFLGVGRLRPAPGTWGALATLPLVWLLYTLVGPFTVLAAALLAATAGTRAIEAYLADRGDSDPPEVVIDEVAGQIVALLPVVFGAWWVGAEITALWPGWLAAFLLFRLFDIWKPGPIGRADRLGTPWGVMLDDLIAGAFAAIGVVLLAALAHLPVIL